MAKAVAICGMIGSTARVNSVDAKTTMPTILKTGGMASAHILLVTTCFWSRFG
jgi:hypothetical protein